MRGVELKSHCGKTDKSDQPYILHPLRLMLKFEDKNLQIVALLHDVVEDSNYMLQNLEELGFSKEIVEAIDCLTKRPHESYEDFIDRIATNAFARLVKIEDIKDNLNLKRLDSLNRIDLERIEKYHRAIKRLSTSLG